MKASLLVSSIIVRSWSNQLRKLVGGNRVIGWLMAVMAGLSLLLGYFITKALVYPMFVALSSDRPLILSIANLLLANIAMTAAVLLGVFLLLSPSRTSLDNLLVTKPLTHAERSLGYLVPLIAVTMAVLVLFYSPIVAALLRNVTPSAGAFVWASYVLFNHAVYVVLLSLVAYLFTYAMACRLLGLHHSLLQLAATLVAVASPLVTFGLSLKLGNVAQGEFPLHHLNPYILLLRDMLLQAPTDSLGRYALYAPLPIVANLVLWVVVQRIAGMSYSTDISTKAVLLRRLPFGRPAPVVFLSVELRQAVRHPENLIFSTFFVCASLLGVAAALATGGRLDAYLLGLPVLIWVVSSIFAQNSYGRTQPSHWIPQVVPSRRSVWLCAKMTSNCMYSAGLAAILFAIFSLISEQTSLSFFLDTLPLGILLTLGFMLLGTVLPYSSEYPFSTALSSLFGIAVGIPATYAIQRLLSSLSPDMHRPVGIVAIAVIALLIWGGDQWRLQSGNAI